MTLEFLLACVLPWGLLDCDAFWCEAFLAGLYADQDHDLLWSLE